MLWTTGVAVGCGWQAFVAYVNVGCYYVVGVPLGVFLGFYLDLGAKVIINASKQTRRQTSRAADHVITLTASACVQGIWSGMVIGGTMMQTLILLWVTFRTDWTKEVNARPLHAQLRCTHTTHCHPRTRAGLYKQRPEMVDMPDVSCSDL